MFVNYKPTISHVTELTLRKQKGTEFPCDWFIKLSVVINNQFQYVSCYCRTGKGKVNLHINACCY